MGSLWSYVSTFSEVKLSFSEKNWYFPIILALLITKMTYFPEMICLFRKWLVIAHSGDSFSKEKLSFWEKNWQYITDSYLPCNILGIVSHRVFREVFIYLFINKKVIQAVQCQIVKTILYTQYIHRIWVNFKQMSDLERTFGVENTQWMKIVSDRAFSFARTTDSMKPFFIETQNFWDGALNSCHKESGI